MKRNGRKKRHKRGQRQKLCRLQKKFTDQTPRFGHRQSMVLATKYTNAPPGNDPNAAGNQRKREPIFLALLPQFAFLPRHCSQKPVTTLRRPVALFRLVLV
jgi:hypothetical protein